MLQMDEKAFNAILENVTCAYENDNPKKYNELMSQYRAGRLDREQVLLWLVDDVLCPVKLRSLDKILAKTKDHNPANSNEAMWLIRRMTRNIISVCPTNFRQYVIFTDVVSSERDGDTYLDFIFETIFSDAAYTISYPIGNYPQCDRHWLCKCINQAVYHIYCTVMIMIGDKLDESDPYVLRAMAAKIIEAEIDDLMPIDKRLYILG